MSALRPRCLWCGQPLEDGREETGFTGEGPDWGAAPSRKRGIFAGTKAGTMLDYGCDMSPNTDPDDGAGSHTPDLLPTWDGHLVRVKLAHPLTRDHLHNDNGPKPARAFPFRAFGAFVARAILGALILANAGAVRAAQSVGEQPAAVVTFEDGSAILAELDGWAIVRDAGDDADDRAARLIER